MKLSDREEGKKWQQLRQRKHKITLIESTTKVIPQKTYFFGVLLSCSVSQLVYNTAVEERALFSSFLKGFFPRQKCVECIEKGAKEAEISR